MEDKRTTNWPQPDGTQRKPNPFNLMIKHRHVHRRGRRSHVTVSYTDPQVSMDLLRAVLQPSFNNDIMAVFRKYHKFFEKAAQNVKENVGEDVHTDQLITEACRNVLEHAKVLFPESDVKKSTSEANVKRSRGSEDGCSQRGSPVPKKRKNRVSGAMASERSCNFATHVKAKCDAVKRDGPKWEPSRLSESSTFVLGSRANKALGMGGTRGRIYIKHADLFKVNKHAHACRIAVFTLTSAAHSSVRGGHQGQAVAGRAAPHEGDGRQDGEAEWLPWRQPPPQTLTLARVIGRSGLPADRGGRPGSGAR
ncbi:deoxynucleotidyltransferase terminal-interacting protein 1 isoform X1 [Phyllopteryx taeniolatus]|uniref:deoxynucleotidyltransferase terminal-interacting protein 1 isoform X1 n=1 Tax=Phyllopteryx taeniolatus TaxID=161469 RepID=UPI002AD481C3|nr:deoxynucleotidyltransferase terminal-interacting protein 1 isoform X1 [Phyllopteryx taeniolatus]XP_061641529.1 deoxynucleotidyltransferase terminal-interacting protein 1 isoform X1 [Phyllopteryx taeniolatus]